MTDEQLEQLLALVASALAGAADFLGGFVEALAGVGDVGRFLAWLFEREPPSAGWV